MARTNAVLIVENLASRRKVDADGIVMFQWTWISPFLKITYKMNKEDMLRYD